MKRIAYLILCLMLFSCQRAPKEAVVVSHDGIIIESPDIVSNETLVVAVGVHTQQVLLKMHETELESLRKQASITALLWAVIGSVALCVIGLLGSIFLLKKLS